MRRNYRRTSFKPAQALPEHPAPTPAQQAENKTLKAEVEQLRAEKKEWDKVFAAILGVVRRFPEAMQEVVAAVEATRDPCPA